MIGKLATGERFARLKHASDRAERRATDRCICRSHVACSRCDADQAWDVLVEAYPVCVECGIHMERGTGDTCSAECDRETHREAV